MSNNLVIVESPAKAKTISKYLGKDFDVMASYGHVRDLVPKEGAVDPEQDFEMKYQVIERNEKHVKAIVRALKKADALYLATDPDREGEAISWHLVELLKPKVPFSRLVFHEITKDAIQEALDSPRPIDDRLVQIKHIADIIGTKISDNPQLIVAFKTDTYADYGTVSDVMEELKEVNAVRVFFNNDVEGNPGQKF